MAQVKQRRKGCLLDIFFTVRNIFFFFRTISSLAGTFPNGEKKKLTNKKKKTLQATRPKVFHHCVTAPEKKKTREVNTSVDLIPLSAMISE